MYRVMLPHQNRYPWRCIHWGHRWGPSWWAKPHPIQFCERFGCDARSQLVPPVPKP
jgi:hypothetical protein